MSAKADKPAPRDAFSQGHQTVAFDMLGMVFY